MVVDPLSSAHRRSQNAIFLSPPSKKQAPNLSEFDSWPVLLKRHRFLLTMLALLAFLCTIYLYFAITLGAADPCSAMSGVEKTSSSGALILEPEHLEEAKKGAELLSL